MPGRMKMPAPIIVPPPSVIASRKPSVRSSSPPSTLIAGSRGVGGRPRPCSFGVPHDERRALEGVDDLREDVADDTVDQRRLGLPEDDDVELVAQIDDLLGRGATLREFP